MRLDELRAGLELGPTGWLDVTQERIDAFAEATGDPQWIHIDPARGAEGPFGGTVAHGFLTLSLLVPLLMEAAPVEDATLAINYGVNRVRFPAPLPSGSRIRARFRVESAEPVEGGLHVVFAATVEREGGEKPICAAELVLRYAC